MKNLDIEVTETINYRADRVSDLLCAAFEGGSNYWIESIESTNHRELGFEYYHEAPLHPEGEIVFLEEDRSQRQVLNNAKVIQGLQIMADTYPRHMDDFRDGCDDAETGDVFLQCCLFGEIRYS